MKFISNLPEVQCQPNLEILASPSVHREINSSVAVVCCGEVHLFVFRKFSRLLRKMSCCNKSELLSMLYQGYLSLQNRVQNDVVMVLN
jgi:hypothetical protein